MKPYDKTAPYDYWMASLYQISHEKRRRAREMAGGAKSFYRMTRGHMEGVHLFTEKEILCICESKESFDVCGEWDRFLKKNIRFITYYDEEYPKSLRNIRDAPFALFVKGSLPSEERKSVAVVGARNCTEYGRSVADLLGRTMAKCGVQVISGMALGVDSASHAGALKNGGDTYAVLGSGCDVCYPKTSINIYNNILSGTGGILSELIPGTQPRPLFFPMRNRIISALSDILIVVEAREKSGSLITADFALEQGKDVYAVPGRYLDSLSAGCNRLIEQGAGIFVDMDSFLKNTGIGTSFQKKERDVSSPLLSEEEKRVFCALELNAKHLEAIVADSGLHLLTVLETLDTLKKLNLAAETVQNYFCRRI